MRISDYLYSERCRESSVSRDNMLEQFHSDRSRIIFCSSFRRMMQKAQVFSLESNSSVRNRLTHSLEVADIGKILARRIGYALKDKSVATDFDINCLESIVENACLIHDIGNPPFGHFGEEAIKRWSHGVKKILKQKKRNLSDQDVSQLIFDLSHFDGNPQGFRIVTKLHTEIDQFGLNLTHSTLLSFLKYPCSTDAEMKKNKYKKIGIFSSESARYKQICDATSHPFGKRYFLVYLMEFADDVCYCLSDIADAFEKKIIDSRFFKEEFKKILRNSGGSDQLFRNLVPISTITNFAQQISIPVCRRCIDSATKYFVTNLESYIAGEGKELSEVIEESQLLKSFKVFAKKYIYTESEVQRIEIAGNKVVSELLTHFGMLLELSSKDFQYFYKCRENIHDKQLNLEWRIFNQLSSRMLDAYNYCCLKHQKTEAEAEAISRCRLIVDYISGMTDQSALQFYQNHMAIKL